MGVERAAGASGVARAGVTLGVAACLALALTACDPVAPGSGDAPDPLDAPMTDAGPPPDAGPGPDAWERPEAPPCPPAAPATYTPPRLLGPDEGLHRWFESRVAPRSVPRDPAALAVWQADVRDVLRAGLGFDRIEPPETPVPAAPLAPVQLGPVQAGRWLVQVHPGTWVPTLLLTPTPMVPGPRPGVLLQHGHNAPGKTRAAIFTLGVNLAARGCVVAMPDWPGYGDLDEAAWAHLLTTANLLAGRSMNVPITSIPRRVLDWLASRPEVDPTRLAVAGHSGGGETAMYLAAVDTRVRAAAVVDGVDDWGWRLANGLVKDPEHYPIGLIARAGYPEVLALVAPRWLTVISGDKDHVAAPTEQIADVVAAARPAWADLEERLVHVGVNKGHELGRAKREAVYAAFGAALGEPLEGPEDGTLWKDAPDLHIVPPDDNRATIHMVRAWLAQADAQRTGPHAASLRGVLGEPAAPQGATWEQAGALPHGTRFAGRVVRPGAPPIPADLLHPGDGGPAPRGALVCFADGGRAGCAALGEQLAATGLVVAAADLRGQGELEGDWPHDLPNQRLRLAFLSMALGDPLPNQQLRDVFAVREALADRIGALPTGVVGLGPRAGLLAALAGVVDPSLAQVVAPGAETDLRRPWDTRVPTEAMPAESYPYGLLTALDPAELPALLGPRGLQVGAPWTGAPDERTALCNALRAPWGP